MERILSKTRELGDMIQQSEIYKNYQLAKADVENDEEVQQMISQYNLMRSDLYELMRDENASDEEREALDAKIKDLSDEIMSKEVMVNFNFHDNRFGEMVDRVNKIMQFYISGEGACSPSQCGSCQGCHE
jgi:cell fate (sporulation/competence/biofilm development) regulator YlbF (YheA/YmcA/DUF963 family)